MAQSQSRMLVFSFPFFFVLSLLTSSPRFLSYFCVAFSVLFSCGHGMLCCLPVRCRAHLFLCFLIRWVSVSTVLFRCTSLIPPGGFLTTFPPPPTCFLKDGRTKACGMGK